MAHLNTVMLLLYMVTLFKHCHVALIYGVTLFPVLCSVLAKTHRVAPIIAVIINPDTTNNNHQNHLF